jgi:hypothetical protein
MAFSLQPGPGPSPSVWQQNGADIFYPLGGVVLPDPSVQGGSQGTGSINANGLFVQGHPVSLVGGQISQLNQGNGITLSPSPILTVGTINVKDSAVTPGTYGDASDIPKITVDQQGRVTALSVVPITIPSISISAGVGITVTPSPITGSGNVSLANTAVTAGSYGDAGHIATFTVNAQGQLTAAGTAAIAAGVTVQDAPPASPVDNSLWWKSDIGQLMLRYNDGDSTQWVPAAPAVATAAVLRGFIDGFQHTIAGGNQSYSVGSGMAADSTNAFMISRQGAISKTLAAWAIGSGVGSLDTGAVAANTWYHSYEIFNSSTGVVDHLVSLQPTNANPAGTPTLPSGYTYYRLVGAMVTDASANLLGIVQKRNEFLFKVPLGNSTASGTGGLIGVSVPPGRSTKGMFNIMGTVGSIGGRNVLAYSPLVSAQTAFSPGGNAQLSWSNDQQDGAYVDIWTNTAQQVSYDDGSTPTNFYIATVGWADPRGQDQ